MYTSTDGCSSRSGSAVTTSDRRPVPSSSSSCSVTPGTRSFQRSSPSILMMLGIVVRVPGIENRGPPLVVALGDRVAFLDVQDGALRHRVAVEHVRLGPSDRRPGCPPWSPRWPTRPRGSAPPGSCPWCRPRTRPGRSAYSRPLVYFTTPSDRARRSASSAMRDEVPPMWKVRRVSWVPGSPIDCAARMPDRLAHVHHVHGGQVPAVAHPADAAPGLAGEHRADLHLLDAGVLDGVGGLLVDQLAGLHQQLGIAVLVELVRIEDVLARDAAEQSAP